MKTFRRQIEAALAAPTQHRLRLFASVIERRLSALRGRVDWPALEQSLEADLRALNARMRDLERGRP